MGLETWTPESCIYTPVSRRKDRELQAQYNSKSMGRGMLPMHCVTRLQIPSCSVARGTGIRAAAVLTLPHHLFTAVADANAWQKCGARSQTRRRSLRRAWPSAAKSGISDLQLEHLQLAATSVLVLSLSSIHGHAQTESCPCTPIRIHSSPPHRRDNPLPAPPSTSDTIASCSAPSNRGRTAQLPNTPT